jgi:SAM-dependent methyltransferase
MSYRPREFWDRRLAEHFDLRGTGQPGLSLAYNRACYRLRRRVLDRALADAGFEPEGKRGARLTGVDIAPTSVETLRARHPEARFLLADISEARLEERFDLVNAFDVLYHITDDGRWERALQTIAEAVEPGGLLLLTDTFAPPPGATGQAEHNRMRPLELYRERLERAGFSCGPPRATHVLLNRELGAWRFLNRVPAVLFAADVALLALGRGRGPAVSKLLVARRRA